MRSWQVRFRMVVAVGATCVLLTGACSSLEPGSPAATGNDGEPRDEPQEVRIVAVDYAYPEAPVELEGGVIDLTFENQGTVKHEVALAGIGDTPLDRLVEDLGGGNGLEGKPLPVYLDQVAVPSFVSIGAGKTAEATFTLTPGRYALFCAATDAAKGDEQARHYQLGMIRAVTVSGGDAVPQLPEADGTIIATDYDFEVDIQAGDRSVNFINAGPNQIHVAFVERFPAGVDGAEAERAYLARLEPGPLPDGVPRTEDLGFTSGIFSAGLGTRLEFGAGVLRSGRTYLFSCFLSDREGGEGHETAYDQYEIVTIG